MPKASKIRNLIMYITESSRLLLTCDVGTLWVKWAQISRDFHLRAFQTKKYLLTQAIYKRIMSTDSPSNVSIKHVFVLMDKRGSLWIEYHVCKVRMQAYRIKTISHITANSIRPICGWKTKGVFIMLDESLMKYVE